MESISELSVKEINSVLDSMDLSSTDAIERNELEERVKSAILERPTQKYNLVANICHDSPPGQGKEDQSDPLQVHTFAGFCHCIPCTPLFIHVLF